MATREEKFELIQKHLAHLDAKVLAMVEGKEEDVVFCIKQGGFSVHNVRAHDEFFIEVFGSHYYDNTVDGQKMAERMYECKAKDLATRELVL